MSTLRYYEVSDVLADLNYVTCIEAALFYAQEYKWLVVPAHGIDKLGHCTCSEGARCEKAGKHLITGIEDGTTDLNQICKLWKKYPYANVAVVTGKASNLYVMNVDYSDDPTADGDKTIMDLFDNGYEMPFDSLFSNTGKGAHFFHKHPDPRCIIPNIKRLKPGIDIVCDGGYVIVAPSRHKNGSQYRWADQRLIFGDEG